MPPSPADAQTRASTVASTAPSSGTNSSGTNSSGTNRDPAERMDRMYRWTRHIYDATRRYYLLGRDRVLKRIAKAPRAAVLEVGCGTGRNLRRLARLAPQHRLYGVDASRQMLDTARSSLRRAGVSGQIELAQGLAETFDPEAWFGRRRPFDVLLFSYVLSMIPDWRAAVDAAVDALPPQGRLHVVDFWDQGDLPDGFAALLTRWLALFGVHHRPALLDRLRAIDRAGTADLSVEPVARRYAYIATLVKE